MTAMPPVSLVLVVLSLNHPQMSWPEYGNFKRQEWVSQTCHFGLQRIQLIVFVPPPFWHHVD